MVEKKVIIEKDIQEKKVEEKLVKKEEKVELTKDIQKLKKEAEKESLEKIPKNKSLTKEERLKILKEKAAKLMSEKLDKLDLQSMKDEVKLKKRSDMLVDLEEYVKTGIYLGTRVVTPDMRKFIYRRRADGLAIFNTDLIDEKMKEGAKYLSEFKAEDVILVCKRQSCHKVAKKFGEVTGIRIFTKKYPAGAMTNPQLDNFFEAELTIITDHWLEKNALKDSVDMKKNVLMICGTNNFSTGANKIIIGNNKSPKSVGLVYYLLAREYLKSLGKDTDVLGDMDWWISGDED